MNLLIKNPTLSNGINIVEIKVRSLMGINDREYEGTINDTDDLIFDRNDVSPENPISALSERGSLDGRFADRRTVRAPSDGFRTKNNSI